MENVEKILQKLQEELEFAIGTPDEARVAADKRAFEQWVQKGMRGKCPIKLSDYGIESEEAEPESEPLVSPSTAEPSSESLPGAEFSSASAATESPAQESVVSGPEEAAVEAELPQPAPELSLPLQEEFDLVDEEEVARDALDLEQASLHRELERAREYLSRSQWREALNLAETIEKRAEGELKASAHELLEQARIGLNTALNDLLTQANAARSAGDIAKARELYNAVLTLERENSDARLALQEMDGLVQERVSEQKLSELRAGLKERRDIKRLGDAVYDAEALDQEGRLPDELTPLLKEAREFYDKTRLQMGEETTQMRFGDIEARAKAVADLQARVVKGDKYILDATTGTERPAAEVLR